MKSEVVIELSEPESHPNNLRVSSRLRRSSQQHPKSENESSSAMTSPSHSLVESPSKVSVADSTESKRSKPQSLVSVHNINNRKIYTCERCGLEFTSANSVFRHQEKSCLRVRVINLKPGSKAEASLFSVASKKKCPICSCIFYSTHRVSIHIYKHHKNLLGSALQPPSAEAKRLNDIQLKKVTSFLFIQTNIPQVYFELITLSMK